MTVGETKFFRDPEHFEFIRRLVLPDVARRRGSDHVVRVWSAGCATGEEAYTLAIVLQEVGLADRSFILATDISRRSLEAARRARYRSWTLRGVDPELKKRYLPQVPQFEVGRRDAEFVLSSRLRDRVDFEYLNLTIDPYPSLENGTWGMDLIMCRGVLMSLDEHTLRHVVESLGRCLADGGWLMLGPSDPPIPHGGPLDAVVTAAGVFYRRAAAP